MNKKCDCCKKETPAFSIFKYTYGSRTYNLCNMCYVNVEEHLINKGNKIKLSLTPFEIKKLQLKNEQINHKINNLDFSIFPRTFLEDFLSYLRKKDFTNFKRYLKQYEDENQINIIHN